MSNSYCTAFVLVAGLAAGASVIAAPLDALLTTEQIETPGSGEVELGYDAANSSLDFLNVRSKNDSSSNVGDYKGEHIRGGVAITPRLWIDGAFWRRKIDYRSFVADLSSWQVAGQYKFLDGSGYVPSLAVRVGAWGNYSSSLTKSTNSTVGGTKFTSATVSEPTDIQYQLNLIGTWPVTRQFSFSVFGGAGSSTTGYDNVSATARTANGCEYNVAFVDAGAVSTLARPCNASGVVTRFSQSNSATFNVNKEAKYKAYYYQAGLMASWTVNDWRVRGGYQYQTINRDQIDDIIASRGGVAYKNNQVFIADVSYKLFRNTTVFLRGQYMKNQFNGEIPLAYNTLTADRFNQHYGILSTGLIFTF
jgi:hypothetical protein